MEYIPYVGFATSNRATVMIHLCLYKKKKKKFVTTCDATWLDQLFFLGTRGKRLNDWSGQKAQGTALNLIPFSILSMGDF
jgi:hypothetical protein